MSSGSVTSRAGQWGQAEQTRQLSNPPLQKAAMGSVRLNAPTGERCAIGKFYALPPLAAPLVPLVQNSSPEAIRPVLLIYVRISLSLRNVEDGTVRTNQHLVHWIAFATEAGSDRRNISRLDRA